jgi:hypothetical protein
VLHVQNPFAGKDHTIDLPYNPNEYADRIRNLLKQHVVQMVDGATVWLVTITNDKVLVQNATGTPPPSRNRTTCRASNPVQATAVLWPP